MNNFKSYVIKYYLVLLGLLISNFYFWNRFFRERTIKDLPFNLTILHFFILVYICSIFSFILYTMFFKKRKNEIIEILVDWLFTPLKELEIFIRHSLIGNKNYMKFLTQLYSSLEFSIIKSNAFYIIFWVFPRLLLLIALFIDVFIFHQMNYKYQVILFGLLLLFNRYFKYSLKNLKDELIKDLFYYVTEITVKYQPYIHPSELEPDYDPEEDDNDDWPPTMNLPLETYIKYNTESMVYENKSRLVIFFSHTQNAKKLFWEKYVGEKFNFYYNLSPLPLNYKNKFGDKAPENYMKAYSFVLDKLETHAETSLNYVLEVNLLLEHLNKTSNFDSNIRKLKILIYLNYLLCWLYVLIISLPNLDIQELLKALEEILKQLTEPFSDIRSK